MQRNIIFDWGWRGKSPLHRGSEANNEEEKEERIERGSQERKTERKIVWSLLTAVHLRQISNKPECKRFKCLSITYLVCKLYFGVETPPIHNWKLFLAYIPVKLPCNLAIEWKKAVERFTRSHALQALHKTINHVMSYLANILLTGLASIPVDLFNFFFHLVLASCVGELLVFEDLAGLNRISWDKLAFSY